MTQTQINPGSWLGVLGGGQLGRMFTHAAQRLGYHVAVFETEAGCPASQAADRHFCPAPDGSDTQSLLTEMAQLCSAITLEFENVSVAQVQLASNWTLAHPNAEFLSICQDRIREKASLADAGLPTTPFVAVSSSDEVLLAGEQLGWPLVLKTAQSGYDGKGQALVKNPSEVQQAWDGLESTHVIAEKWIAFEAEVSMLTARNLRGEVESYPLLENHHANHILDVSFCPASPSLLPMQAQAQAICRRIAEQFSVVGIFCVEFFVTKTGELMINEIAPRPHNSGHLTIEAFTCSQFEQQVRAICNLPLVPAKLIEPAAMINILGDVWESGDPRWEAALGDRNTHLHLYGKASPRVGRKMGHVTCLDTDSQSAAERARRIHRALHVGAR